LCEKNKRYRVLQLIRVVIKKIATGRGEVISLTALWQRGVFRLKVWCCSGEYPLDTAPDPIGVGRGDAHPFVAGGFP
jgi:hypothetical protein